jgi:hypothetical protein
MKKFGFVAKMVVVMVSLLCVFFIGCGPPKNVSISRVSKFSLGGQGPLTKNTTVRFCGCKMYSTGSGGVFTYDPGIGNELWQVRWEKRLPLWGLDTQKNLALLKVRQAKKRTFTRRRAAYLRHATAQFGLGAVPQVVQRYAWHSLTVAGGHADAGGLNNLAKKMTPEQIARGQELARELDKNIYAAK